MHTCSPKPLAVHIHLFYISPKPPAVHSPKLHHRLYLIHIHAFPPLHTHTQKLQSVAKYLECVRRHAAVDTGTVANGHDSAHMMVRVVPDGIQLSHQTFSTLFAQTALVRVHDDIFAVRTAPAPAPVIVGKARAVTTGTVRTRPTRERVARASVQITC